MIMIRSTLAARVAFHEIPGLRASLLVLIVVLLAARLARSTPGSLHAWFFTATLPTGKGRVGGAEHIEDVTLVTGGEIGRPPLESGT
jgi:hypothetical protein